MQPAKIPMLLTEAAGVVQLLCSSHEASCEKIEALERELAERPTAWAYQQACKALHHWREEARRLGALAGEEPRLLGEMASHHDN